MTRFRRKFEKQARNRGLLVSSGESGSLDLFTNGGRYVLSYTPWLSSWRIGNTTGPAQNWRSVLLLAEFVAAKVDGQPRPASRARIKRKFKEGVTA